MIRYNGTPETVHFVNWILHSGCVDPLALADKAVSQVDMEADNAAVWMRDVLARLLEEALSVWADQFAPDFNLCAADSVETAAELYDEVVYQEAGPNCLLVPLLYSAIQRIDFWQAADHIYVYIFQAFNSRGRKTKKATPTRKTRKSRKPVVA